MPISIAEMTRDELFAYKLRLHHKHRDYRYDARLANDPHLIHKYNMLCEHVEHSLRAVYDELTRREADTRLINIALH